MLMTNVGTWVTRYPHTSVKRTIHFANIVSIANDDVHIALEHS